MIDKKEVITKCTIVTELDTFDIEYHGSSCRDQGTSFYLNDYNVLFISKNTKFIIKYDTKELG